MTRLSAGALRHRIRVEENRSIAQDEHGQPIDNWTVLYCPHANITPLSGRESFYAQQVRPDATHQITLRTPRSYRLTADMRIVFKGRVFELLEPPRDIDERRTKTEVLVKEKT